RVSTQYEGGLRAALTLGAGAPESGSRARLGGGIVVLLEREEPLVLLEGALARARDGRGHSVFIGGEAGIGKTSVVESSVRSQEQGVRVRWGACEALSTPRPLGPLYDIAHEIGGRLLNALDADRPPHRLFQVFIDELRAADRPTVIVVEDAHWADD